MVRLDGAAVAEADIARLTELIAHRGPDDAGVFVDGCAGFGHRRLSIVDLSHAGHQPMHSLDGSRTIVFNGEIYNHRALRRELAALGYPFASQTDTEVILAAHAAWGDACVERFEGMWSFALWERRRRRLFCSRDRLGIKPFLYHVGPHAFVFGSEIKVVLASGLAPRAVHLPALRLMLVYRARASAVESCFEGIVQLPAGHNLVLEDGRVSLSRYWDPDEFRAEPGAAPPPDAAARLRQVLQDAVQSHLRADVAVGSCLSGGLDSSTLTALAARSTTRPLATFSIVYPGTPYDETQWIRALIAATPNLDPYEDAPDGRDVIDVLERAQWHFEEPLWGGSVYSWWRVMRLIHAHGIKVVLNGQGGDELLAGYPRHQVTLLRELWCSGRLARFVREFGAAAERERGGPAALAQSIAAPFVPELLRRLLRRLGRGRAFDDSWLSPPLRAARSVRDDAAARRAFTRLDDHLRSDLTLTRLPELLQAEDRFSMAFSIESRVPLLDHRVVEFALALPSAAKLAGGVTKRVLRDAMRDLLPAPVLERRDKQGYPTPVEEFLRRHAVPWCDELLDSVRFRQRGVFDAERVVRGYRDWRSGRAPMPELWTVLSTELWFRRFIDQAPAA